MSLLHLLHLGWVELVHSNLARKMMSTEKNVDVVCIENFGKLIIAFINVHLRRKWKGLHEEHAVGELCRIWMIFLLPENLDWLCEGSWNESAVWLD